MCVPWNFRNNTKIRYTCSMIPKIVFFDCDGVLIGNETWDAVLNSIKFPRLENERLTRLYYSGKLAYKDWIKKQEIYFRQNFTKDIYKKQILSKIKINPEAKILVKFLANMGIPMAIISSGETEYVKIVAKSLGIETFRVNTFFHFAQNGRFAHMDYIAEDPDAKVIQIKEICSLYGCQPEETIFVGDSDNDIKAFQLTKHGILYSVGTKSSQKAAWKKVGKLTEVNKLLSYLL